MTKMYNRMYWNDIIQLIFSYTYITFALFNALFYTTYKWYYSISVTDSISRGYFLSYCTASCLQKNINSII